MTNQEYIVRVGLGSDTLKDDEGTDNFISQTDYFLWGQAADTTAPEISGVNVINDTEIEVLFTEDNGINIYGADASAGGTGSDTDATFQISPGLGTISAYEMWDRVGLTTETAQTSGTTYTVAITNLRDRATPSANILSANSGGGTTDNQITFTGFNSSSFDDGATPYIYSTMPFGSESDVPMNLKRLRAMFSEDMTISSFTYSEPTPNADTDTVLLGKVNAADWTLDTIIWFGWSL